MQTYDKRTVDATGSFLQGELERLDSTLNAPLLDYSYTRDLPLRTDVSLADEFASYTLSDFAAGSAKSGYIGKVTDQVQQVGLDLKKIVNPLNLWAKKASWTVPELASAMQLGRPVDVQKVEMLVLDWNFEADKAAYIGSPDLGTTGLLNNSSVSQANAANGSWSNSATTADEIIADIEEVLQRAYANAGYAVAPTDLLVDPISLGILVSRKVSDAGNLSIAEFIKTNCISNTVNGRALNIRGVKWLTSGQAVSNKTRMVAYSNDARFVRFPIVPIQRQQMVYADIAQSVSYLGRHGVTEVRYKETISYSDFTL